MRNLLLVFSLFVCFSTGSPLAVTAPGVRALASFFKSDAYYLLRLTTRDNCTSKCAHVFKNGIYTEGSSFINNHSLEGGFITLGKATFKFTIKNNQVMQRIKKYTLAVLMMVAFATYCTAQATDTIQLSVFNTGAKYRLTPATFGAPTTGAELLTEMVFVHDTIMSYVETGSNGTTFMPPKLVAKMSDSLRRVFQSHKLMRPVITYRCDKPIREDVKDKVVIMTLGTCDPSVMCMNAQNAGAKVVILIHPSNKVDSIVLKKGPGRDSLKIRCYSVTRDAGAKISALMPSHVAIKKRVVTPNQNLVAQTNNGSMTTATPEKVAEIGDNAENTEGSSESTASSSQKSKAAPTLKNSPKVQFTVSPNPSHDQTTLTYQFSQPTDVNLFIETISGQVIQRQILKGITVGRVDIQTSEWANGTYILSMQYGKEMKTKKFEVQH